MSDGEDDPVLVDVGEHRPRGARRPPGRARRAPAGTCLPCSASDSARRRVGLVLLHLGGKGGVHAINAPGCLVEQRRLRLARAQDGACDCGSQARDDQRNQLRSNGAQHVVRYPSENGKRSCSDTEASAPLRGEDFGDGTGAGGCSPTKIADTVGNPVGALASPTTVLVAGAGPGREPRARHLRRRRARYGGLQLPRRCDRGGGHSRRRL